MLQINDRYGPDDDRSLGLGLGQRLLIRTRSGAEHTGTVSGLGLHYVDLRTPHRCRIRLASIESVTTLPAQASNA